ncbi:MAG TPA: hypothetical protein VM432_08075 [Bdellovibrionales bacterium]|nr:hypothetical protein [Bdellovibrionales bacterium]
MSKRPSFFRRILLIDKKLQLSLLVCAFYISVVFTSFTFIAATLLGRISREINPHLYFESLIVVLVGGLVATIAAIYLMLVTTNRIAGPLYRLRTEFIRVRSGGAPQKITIRKDDMLEEVIGEYNRMVESLNKDRS